MKSTLPEPARRAKDLEFTVEVELLPEIAPPDFAALSLDPPQGRAHPESVDKALAEIAAPQRC